MAEFNTLPDFIDQGTGDAEDKAELDKRVDDFSKAIALLCVTESGIAYRLEEQIGLLNEEIDVFDEIEGDDYSTYEKALEQAEKTTTAVKTLKETAANFMDIAIRAETIKVTGTKSIISGQIEPEKTLSSGFARSSFAWLEPDNELVKIEPGEMPWVMHVDDPELVAEEDKQRIIDTVILPFLKALTPFLERFDKESSYEVVASKFDQADLFEATHRTKTQFAGSIQE